MHRLSFLTWSGSRAAGALVIFSSFKFNAKYKFRRNVVVFEEVVNGAKNRVVCMIQRVDELDELSQ